MRRRDVLKLTGGGLLLAAAGGAVWRAQSQAIFSPASGPAYDLWKIWDSPIYRGSVIGVAMGGMLAANPHNTQPWLFEVREGKNPDAPSESEILLYADESRNLGAFDPFLREMYTGLGCAVENMLICADLYGYNAHATLSGGTLSASNTGGQRLAARVILRQKDQRRTFSGLYSMIGKRHTNRGPYVRAIRVENYVLDRFKTICCEQAKVHLFDSGAEREMLDSLIVQATESIIADEEMLAASHHWFRHNRADIDRHGDGVTIDSTGIPSWMAAGGKFLPALSAEQGHAIWLSSTRDVHLATAPWLGVITVPARFDRRRAMEAGRLWQRLHLMATDYDIAMQPLNQPCEMIDRARQLNRHSSEDDVLSSLTGGDEAVFIFRFGHPERAALPSPRRNWREVVS